MKKYHFEILLFTFYFLLAVVITYPLILNFSSSIHSIPERTIDSFGSIYYFWCQKEAFLRGFSPNSAPLLGVSGVELPRLPFYMMITSGLGEWLTIVINEVFAYNLLTLLGFPLAGLAMYLLAFEVTKNKYASVLAGFIFAFAPLHRRYSFEWLGNSQWHWLPLYVLCLLKLDRFKSIKWGLLTGLLFSTTFIENYYFGYFAIFFTLAFIFFRLVQLRKNFVCYLKPYLLALFTIVILTLPVTSAFIKESQRIAMGEAGEISGFVREDWSRFAFSARPWFYILPDVHHPVFGQTVQKVYDWIATKPPYFITKPFYPREHSLFLGWTTLFLSAVAVLRLPAFGGSTRRVDQASSKPDGFRRRSAALVWLFLFLGIVMMIFSAPPYATISLHKIYFPSHFLYNFFPMFRSYARFGVLVLLCVSVLAGFGAKFLLEKIKNKKLLPIAYCLLPILIFFEFLDFPPFHNVSTAPLPAYQWLAEQPGDFAIVEYPLVGKQSLLQQRYHRKRLINPPNLTSLEVKEVIGEITDFGTPAKLSAWGVKYLVFHSHTPKEFEDIPGYNLVASFSDPNTYVFEMIPLHQDYERQ